MLLDVKVLKKNRNFRFLYLGQFVSEFGSMMSYIALPYQVYELTGSSFWVGILGAVELVPVVLFGIYGGSFADRMNRKILLIGSELVMIFAVIALILVSLDPRPSLILIFCLAFVLQAASGFHRPSFEALSQSIVEPEDYTSMSALSSVRHSLCAILGPAIGGILMAWRGPWAAYAFDLATFGIALLCIIYLKIPPHTRKEEEASHTATILEGLRYAFRRPELVGTYLVDIIAMTFAFPVALFPEMSQTFGGAKAAGLLLSAMSAGGVITALFSGWTGKVSRHGKAILVAAGLWGGAIVGLGFAPHLYVAVFCLMVAGAADTVSGLFRTVIWSETIPNDKRGRLAGIEMISYMAGPLLGNLRSGLFASATSVTVAILSGGVFCVLGMVVLRYVLPTFRQYEARSPGPNPLKLQS